MKNNITKQNYIQSAYQILMEEGIEAISIRRLAKELDCNTANLYRCFHDLDELILFASLKFLKEYLYEVKEVQYNAKNNLDLFYKIWDCYTKYSFTYPGIFNHLFFGKYSNKIEYIMKEYYSVFPEEISEFDDEMQKVFINGDFNSRNYMMLEKCVKEGSINVSDINIINDIQIYIYRGFLKDILDKRKQTETMEEMKEQFLNCFKYIINQY